MEAVILFAVLFLFLIIGLPVAASIGLSCIVYLITFYDAGMLIQLPTKMFASNDSYVLLAIPLFVFAGYIMEAGGISKRLVDFIYTLVGRLPGALGTVAILACMIFAALTGSAIATVAAIGSIMFPYMVEKGYKKEVAAGMIACAGALGPIIPPSVPMVIYGSTMGVSVADLFLGGVVPGVIMGAAMVVFNTIYALKNKLPKSDEAFSLKKCISALWRSMGVLFLPVLILGGIYGGFITATEAGTLAACYSLLLTLIYRSMSMKTFIAACRKTVVTTGCLLLIINIANMFAYIMSMENIPQKIAKILMPYMNSTATYMIVLFLFLVVVGCVMDSGPAILILAPIIVPIGTSLGINPIFLGTMFCCILCMGAVTPPFGIALFTSASTNHVPFGDVIKGALPYILLSFLVLLLLCFFPDIVMLLL